MNTIAEIAELANVAKSTVSRYLNGGSVSETTRKKIEIVINKTGYMPNAFAQSLKAKKTNIIGTIVPRLDSFASTQILIGIDDKLREQNYQMLISNTSQDLKREIEYIYYMSNQKVAGIILLATQITQAHLEAFDKTKVPVILVGQQHERVYSVIQNDELAAFEMGKYVLEQGHRKIAYLGVTEDDIAVGVKRKEGFQRAIRNVEDCDARYYETSFSMEEAVKKASDIIETFVPTILVCATDNIALGALKAAYLKGLHVPRDISITGFGGYDVSEMIHPSLTTVKFEYKESGQDAANNMVKLLNGIKIPPILLSRYTIIERESVDNILKRQ
ncbi:LacI family DNA-binding transcriptional regulator [Paenibacillus illinoisensis]|uniref:LacI family DNA-binding transcriptional regulator n=1 Tax=Paenibacillus illinoisensis TaxID=59845 RepID=UPI003D2D6A6E